MGLAKAGLWLLHVLLFLADGATVDQSAGADDRAFMTARSLPRTRPPATAANTASSQACSRSSTKHVPTHHTAG